MTGYFPLRSRANEALPYQVFAGADYQPTEDSASVTKLFRQFPVRTAAAENAI
jgi:hypothetical protein